MALAYEVTANGLTYRVVDDIRVLYSVLVFGVVREDVTGKTLAAGFRVAGGPPGLQFKTMAGGIYAVAGYPEQLFPDFANTAHSISLTISASGYQSRTVDVTIPAGSAQPVQAADASLRPLPIRMAGRVTSTADPQPPLGGARITSVDDPNPPPAAEHTILLRQTLQFAHPPNTVVRPMPLTAASFKQLAGGVGPTDVSIVLSDRAGLAAGTILQIGSAEQARFRIIQSLAPLPANPALPGEVTLTGAVGASYPAATPVQTMTTGAAGAAAHLTRDADAGDGVLLLDTLLTDETVEINDPASLEYAAIGALTGSDGYYRADGVGRVKTMFLMAEHAGFVAMPAPLAWTVDYGQPVGFIDFRLSPP